MTTAVQLAQSVAPGVSLGFKNRIINGGMTIDQRNAGASVTGNDGVYTLDRWRCWSSQSSKYTVQQNAGSVTPPAGYKNYLGVTSSSAYSVGSSEYFGIAQYIEGLNLLDLGWGAAGAKSVTLSFQVYSSLTGTFGGAINNSAFNRSYPFSYSIASANTWTSVSVTVPGDTTGTWLTTNGIGMSIVFGLGMGASVSGTAGTWSGSSYYSATGATSVVGTNGATFYITGVQLEVGTAATNFEFRDYGRELIMCQRYCVVYSNLKDANVRWFGYNYNGTVSLNSVTFPVTMRAVPSGTYSTASNFTLYTQSNTAAVTSIAADGASATTANVQLGALSTGGYGTILAFNNADNKIIYSAEL